MSLVSIDDDRAPLQSDGPEFNSWDWISNPAPVVSSRNEVRFRSKSTLDLAIRRGEISVSPFATLVLAQQWVH